jgi:hypothetical protein
VLEARLRPAAVLTACGGEERSPADIAPSAPIAADRPERRIADVPAIRRDADAVDAGAADDRDAPAALAAGPQHCERVVGHDGSLGPTERFHPLAEAVLLGGVVDAGCEDLRHGGQRDTPVEAGVPARAVEQLREHVQAAVETEVMRRAPRSARQREQRAVLSDEG